MQALLLQYINFNHYCMYFFPWGELYYVFPHTRILFPICAHIFYTGQHSPASPLHSTGDAHLVGSSYIRQLSEQMIISQKNIKLLKCIGQGRQVYHILHSLFWWQALHLMCVWKYYGKGTYMSFIGYPHVVPIICGIKL